MQVVQEYLTTDISQEELKKKYNFNRKRVIVFFSNIRLYITNIVDLYRCNIN